MPTRRPHKTTGHGDRLRIATCQFTETFDPLRNGRIICKYIARAAKARADVVHFHECAMSGYGGKVGEKDYDWPALRTATQAVLQQAQASRIWVIVGTSHPLSDGHKPHNSLYIISPEGKIVDRYDKRFCTSGDLECYTSGNHFATFKINGLLCSSLICYDLRFPELYRELARMKVRVVFHSFHYARAKKDNIHRKIMRRTLQGHAGVNNMWISAANSSAHLSCWPGVFITPDGLVASQLQHDKSGMMINTVDSSIDYYDASGEFRDRALDGVLHSGDLVDDPRSRNRTCY